MRILSKRLFDNITAAELDFVPCPYCGMTVVLDKGKNVRDSLHFQKYHDKGKADQPKTPSKKSPANIKSEYHKLKEQLGEEVVPRDKFKKKFEGNPDFQAVEDFEWDEVGDRTGEACPKCGFELTYYADNDPKTGDLWPYFQCEKCGYWKDAPQGEEASEEISIDDLFKTCPKCSQDMELEEAMVGETGKELHPEEYWICDHCGHTEKATAPAQKAWDYKVIDQNLSRYQRRKEVQADQITPLIGLGDVVNGWIMRDKKTAYPYDAILNVSQHSYEPPPDAEYVHIPIDEHNASPEQKPERVNDLAKAIRQLETWTEQGKKVYVHCSEGMNRSPSVIAGYLYNQLNGKPNVGTGEQLYDEVVELINKKRPIAHPYDKMEDALREYLKLAPVQRKPYTPGLKGGWFSTSPTKKKERGPKFPTGTTVYFMNNGKMLSGKVVAPPPPGEKNGVYWISVQSRDAGPLAGVVKMVSEKDLFRSPDSRPQHHYYPGEGTMRTHPKFPPPGGVVKKKKPLSKKTTLTDVVKDKKKKKKPLSKKSTHIPAMRRGGKNVISRFIRKAVSRNELFNFYAIMQLPPAFFAAFPKWEQYAKMVVDKVADEYTRYLEQIVRTEAEETHGVIESEDEYEHGHEWSDYDDEYHQCEDCGEQEYHEDFQDSDEEGHNCGTCGHTLMHDFDSDHYCSVCRGDYPHHWVIAGDQVYRCESGEGQGHYGGYQMGCGAESDTIEADEKLPLYGDFWEAQHQHAFSPFPSENEGENGYRCNVCGRAFLDETGEEQDELELSIQKKPYNAPDTEDLYRDSPKLKHRIREEHDQTNAHTWVLKQPNHISVPDDASSTGWTNVSQYVCSGCDRAVDTKSRWSPETHTWISVPPEEGGIFREARVRFLSKRVADAAEEHWLTKEMREQQEPKAQPNAQQDRRVPVNIDTSKWFDFNVQDPDGQKWIPWKTMRETWPAKYWRTFERAIIQNPESIVRSLTVGPNGKFTTQVDEETLNKFKQMVELKTRLMDMNKEEMVQVLRRFDQYKEKVRTDFDDIFMSMFGLKALFENRKPDDKDAITYQEIKPAVDSAWRTYVEALTEYDPDLAERYSEVYRAAPEPSWASEAEAMSNQVTVATGTGSSPGVASGKAAISAQMALELSGSGRVILVRPETTPEDIAAMKVAAGFLTAHGGPTAHAAIVARQLGKPCVVGAGFVFQNNNIVFPDGKTVEFGGHITINGTTGAVTVADQAEQELPVEEKHVEPLQEGENWDDQFEKILSLDEYMKKSESQDYSYSSLGSMDLLDLAQAFNTDLGRGAYGGKLWGLAAIRAKQLQEAKDSNLPWRYRGMLADQVNTLHHNSGNIFYNKPWPGSPDRFVEEVLDTKATDHAMLWMEMDKDYDGNSVLTEQTKAMLRDYRMWARRNGYPSIYGTDIGALSQEQLEQLKAKEMHEVSERRRLEKHKWKNASRAWVIEKNGVYTAIHKFTRASLVLGSINGQTVREIIVPAHRRGQGIARSLADAIESANA